MAIAATAATTAPRRRGTTERVSSTTIYWQEWRKSAKVQDPPTADPGLRKALKAMWPRSLPQKCQAHKLRNILSKLPRGVQAEFAKRIHAAFRARDYEEGLAKGRELIERYRRRFPNAMECLAKSLEECLTCLKLPHGHRIRVRTTNSLERLIEEGRRRTKVIGPMAGETAGLSLIHAVLVDASKRWHGIDVSSYILEKLEDLRATIAPLADSA